MENLKSHDLTLSLGDAGSWDVDAFYIREGEDIVVKAIRCNGQDITWMFTADKLAEFGEDILTELLQDSKTFIEDLQTDRLFDFGKDLARSLKKGNAS